MVLLTLVMAGGLSFYRSANLQLNKPQQQVTLSTTMARAKEALIAYAVTDDKIPGRLPCPDTNPVDGITDFFMTGICPSNVGWMPWISLDLLEPLDESSTHLWYVLAPGLGNTNQPINSDTATGLTVDGNTDIAALIIAPRSALAGQNRPSNTLSDYLDGENGNGNDNKYVTGPQSSTFNDVVLVITRQELMAAVEKRVANEINSCLAQHASSGANTDKRYPWPAPLSTMVQENNFQGNTDTLFGRVPTTQPSAGLDAQLKASITNLTEAELAVTNAADANKQLTALTALSQNIIEARNLFDVMYTVFTKIKQLTDDIHLKLLAIQAYVDSPKLSDRISRSEGRELRNRSTPELTDSTINTLIKRLGEYGIDVFPREIKKLNAALVSTGNATNLKNQSLDIQLLLAETYTLHPEIDGPGIRAFLSRAKTAANISVAAALEATNRPSDDTLLLAAQAAAELKNKLIELTKSIEGSRSSVSITLLDKYIDPINTLNLALLDSPTEEKSKDLLNVLIETKSVTESLTSRVNEITVARDKAMASLTTAINTFTLSTVNYPLINSLTETALRDIQTLEAMIDNNVSRTSLRRALTNYQTARNSFISIDTATPRPLQSSIPPYAQTLRDATVHIDFWAKLIAQNAATIGTQANSAYSAASGALDSITGNKESADLLQTYIKTPTNTENQTKAIQELAETTDLVKNLLIQADTISNNLSATSASALPIIWLASRCDFLIPGKATWWSNNQWANTAFYQIGAPLMATAAKLTVNGSGNYRTVSIAAGRALSGQTHSTLTIANFLEGSNADTSREGLALTPVTGFVSKPVSSTFNDRLAY
jgi:low affinity Fe/Cu permease